MFDTMPQTVNDALALLQKWGTLETDSPGRSSSMIERAAYDILLADKHPFQSGPTWFLHVPSNRILLRPTVGMGVTLHYPKDCYPYEVLKVVSDKCLEIREMTATPVPGWVADFHPGGFHGHISNLHDQKFTYASNPQGEVLRIRLNKRGHWVHKSTPFSVGHAKYFRDWND